MLSRDITALGYRRIVILLVSLVVVPTVLLLAVGAMLLFLGEAQVNLLMGILVLALSGAAVTGVISTPDISDFQTLLTWVEASRRRGGGRPSTTPHLLGCEVAALALGGHLGGVERVRRR
jgi:hypothetical protein